MRVALLTWFHYHNYGTALQVVALTKKIETLGHTVHVVNYIPEGNLNTLPSSGIVQYYGNKIIKRVLNNVNESYVNPFREQKFEEFLNEQLTFTKRCRTYSDFRDLNEQYEAFIVGSDQIWSPACFDSRYFLDFVNTPEKMIAYAPSLGLSVIKDKYVQEQIQTLTKRFCWISTREQSGSKIISRLIQKNVETVLDPTLLLDKNQWQDYMTDNQIEVDAPYLLVYFLGNRRHYWKTVYSIARRLGLQVKIIPVFQNDLKREGCLKEPIGPDEFLRYCRNASFICTDSFHGTVFAINFHKEFLTFRRFKDNDKNNQNSRIYHILEWSGLEHRIYKKNNFEAIISGKIDYTLVDAKIEKLKDHSLIYLTNALNEVSAYDKNRKSRSGAHIEGLCCGCGVCSVVCPTGAISIQEQKGFYKAVVDADQCISCQKCKKACPFYGQANISPIVDGVNYSYKDKENDVLSRSSSGGIAYRLAQKYLEIGYAVVGCVFDSHSQRAKHILVLPDNKEKLLLLQGSKYMQSDFVEVIPEILECQLPMVIFGTPCQISGMRNLIPKAQKVLYVDLICHGVPSNRLYEKYGDYLQRKLGMNPEHRETVFRYKERGWRERYIYSTDQNVEYCEHQSKDLYFRMFEMGNCYCETCYECRWRDGSVADLRIGDYWGERFVQDHTGVSMVLAMNEKGKNALNMICQYGILKKQDIHDYERAQQTRNNSRPVYYDALMRDLSNPNKDLAEIVEEYVLPLEARKKASHKIAKLRRVLKH